MIYMLLVGDNVQMGDVISCHILSFGEKTQTALSVPFACMRRYFDKPSACSTIARSVDDRLSKTPGSFPPALT